MVDLIASNALYADGDIPDEVQEYLREYQDLQEQIYRQQSSQNLSNPNQTKQELVGATKYNFNRASIKTINEKIQELENQKQEVWIKLHQLDPVIAKQIQVEPIYFETIRQLIPDSKTAMMYCVPIYKFFCYLKSQKLKFIVVLN